MQIHERKLNIVVTGTPGTGKTTIAKLLAKKFCCKAINEKDFAIEKKICKRRKASEETEIDAARLGREINKEFSKKEGVVAEGSSRQRLGASQGVVAEGHLLCEAKLKADFVIVLHAKPKDIEKRLSERGYSDEKILDNIFCEETGYCKKHALRNYQRKRIIEIPPQKSIKETMSIIIRELEKRGIGK